MRSPRLALALGAAAIAGALAASLFRAAPLPAFAADRPAESAILSVTQLRTNDTGVLVYDVESKRLLLYSITHDNKLRFESARNTSFDQKLHDYRLDSEKGYDPRSLKKAVEEEERRAAEKKP